MSENDKVKVTVTKGTVATRKDGTFELGATFTTERCEALTLDPSFVRIEEIPIPKILEVPVVEAKPLPISRKKASVAASENVASV